MKIGIISGSHRNPSQSGKVARYIEQQLSAMGQQTWLYSLADNPLPLWDESVWSNSESWKKLLDPLKQELTDCDGFVVFLLSGMDRYQPG